MQQAALSRKLEIGRHCQRDVGAGHVRTDHQISRSLHHLQAIVDEGVQFMESAVGNGRVEEGLVQSVEPKKLARCGCLKREGGEGYW